MSNPIDLIRNLDDYFFTPSSRMSLSDAWRRSFIPQDGDIVKRSRLVTEEFKVKYEEDGSITLKPVKIDGGESAIETQETKA
jgi:hypothetical protein